MSVPPDDPIAEWMERGTCLKLVRAGMMTQDDWFPDKGQDTKRVRKICAWCPVKEECLAYGMWERYGVWGGTTEGQRRKLRRQWRKAGKLPRSEQPEDAA